MTRRVCFIGHRELFVRDLDKRLEIAIKNEIILGCNEFTMGLHGSFDRLALYSCKNIKKVYKNIELEVVITSLNQIKSKGEDDFDDAFKDVKIVMFEVENVYFKQRITESNKRMIDGCDTLICYVDNLKRKSGAKRAMEYAKRKGLKIINLYLEQNVPFYGMKEEQEKTSLINFIKNN